MGAQFGEVDSVVTGTDNLRVYQEAGKELVLYVSLCAVSRSRIDDEVQSCDGRIRCCYLCVRPDCIGQDLHSR